MTTPSSLSPYLRNATSGPNFVDWAASEAQRSERFRFELDRLRHIAAGSARDGYCRTTGPLSDKSWSDVSELRALGARTSEQRPRAWQDRSLPTDDGLRHVRDYHRGILKTARFNLGTEDAAPLLHELVAGVGYQLAPYAASAPPAPIGGRASSLAAHISGASWGSGATALVKAWSRARPGEIKNRDTFV